MKDMAEYQNRGKVLFTGRGVSTIDNMMEHMPEKYHLDKCIASSMDLLLAIDKIHPHVLVVCLLSESNETLRLFEPFCENPKYEEFPVIVIGKKEDCECFSRSFMIKNVAIFERPLDRNAFLKNLDNFIEMQKERQPEDVESVEEETIDEDFFELPNVQENVLKQVKKLTLLKGRKSILVVDDDVRMLNLIKLHLQDLYDITVVPSGKLALKFLQKKSADLVLLDYMMPEMDGPEVLRRIREESPNIEIPVIFLTSISDRDLVMKGLEFRPNGYILKPATREVLLERVTQTLLGI